ncbi:MAG: hypothetical protein UT34_C0001G0344 [candidate division WS6 bacterium GW2011_GWF2_39_15]|uniref:LytR/CpsA/Psr regulator C-terminal domain-containing protein n=1 Tax=candidate division WS6 bacterium GW2011_GWF2_39_15 TaxID=1619100 RepID=A0A0G0MQJ4_9BACT|nr:MAG: hypothetical protein UT34_C0001G0344 [candidate division WS6 bacterium GW2011_GWF2_39_15]
MKRIERGRQNSGFLKSRKNERKISPLRWIRWVLIILVLTLGVYSSFTVANNLLTADSHCSVCKSRLNLIKERKDLSSTLVIFKSPVDNRLAGGWLIVNNENTGSTLVIYIPPGVYVEDPNQLFNAHIQVADLEYAAKLVNPNRTVEYVVWQIENMTGFTVENYIWLDEKSLSLYATMFGDISEYSEYDFKEKFNPSRDVSAASMGINSFYSRFNLVTLAVKSEVWNKFISGVDSNLTSIALIKLLHRGYSQLDAGGIKMIDLSQKWAYVSRIDSNGRNISVINYPEFDRKIEENFNIIRTRLVEKEQARVEVYNGSGVSGLAGRYARKVQNYGVKVVRYDNAPNNLPKTTIYISDKKKFLNSFNSVEDLVCGKCEIINGRPDFITTGDIIVILGEDKESELRWR